jgi:osomolarity two-component system sensor histidine kinase NIK1
LTSSTGTKKNILVVEDNLINQRVIAKYLDQLGHKYELACNGLEALEKLKQGSFDLVFMDSEMPVMGGLETTTKIRISEQELKSKRIPIIGLSGNAREEQIKDARNCGMDDYVTKVKFYYFILFSSLMRRGKLQKRF